MFLKESFFSEYDNVIVAADRYWLLRMHYRSKNSMPLIPPSCIQSLTMEDYVCDGSNITMGCMAGSKITVNISGIEASVLSSLVEGTRVYFNMYVESGRTPSPSSSSYLLSTDYVITESKRKRRAGDKYDCTLTAYDISYIMTKTYTHSGSLTASEIVSNIADKYGLTVAPSVSTVVAAMDGNTAHTFEAPSGDVTDRQMLAYLAGYYGCYAKIDEFRRICFSWFEQSSDVIDVDRIYESEAYVTEMTERTITMLESGTDDTPIVAPDNAAGFSINFENPYMTAERATAIYNDKIANGKISFRIGKVRYKGNPVNNPGTILTVKDIAGESATFYIMKRTMRYDGGLSETIECMGESEQTVNYKVVSPTERKINRKLSRMEDAIKNATDIITQTKGSIFEFIPVDESDPSKGNSGWLLRSTAAGEQNVILANSSGIGFSSNGGQSFNAAAIYIDSNGVGHINANYIDVGKLSADLIDTSELVVGGGSYDSLDEFLGAVADTAGSSVTKVDVLYARNQSATEAPADSAWSTDPPTWADGYYIWTKTKTTAGGVDSYTEPVCITGAKGSSGKTGRGVTKIEEQYYLSTSSATTRGGSWSSAQPEWRTGYYLWTRSHITWSDNTVSDSEAVLAKAINGANSAVANLEKVGFCVENNKTYINGANILTGSIAADAIAANSITADKLAAGAITAEKVNVGWQSGNLASDWYNPNDLTLSDYFTIDADASNNYYSKVYVKTAYSGTLRCCSKPFYLAAGDRLKYGGEIYNKTATLSGFYIEYSSASDGSYYVVGAANSSSIGESKKENYTYTAASSGWYRFTCAFDDPAAGTYHSGVYCFRSVKGNLIVNGKIESADGQTYFDLDESKLVSQTSAYLTELTSGAVKLSAWNSNTAKWSDAMEIRSEYDSAAGVYGVISWSKKGLRLLSGEDIYATFGDGEVTIPKQTSFGANIYLLWENGIYGSKTTSATRHLIGRINGDEQLLIGWSAPEIRFSVSRSTKLTLNTDGLYWGNNNLTNSSSEKYKTDIQPYTDSALSLVKSSVIYSYKYKSDGENALTKYGLVIERECPQEVVDNSGDAISLYSMCSILWKSVQELNAKIEALGGEKNA